MADVEKAVELLRDVERMARDWRMTDLADRAREALCALGEEWTVKRSGERWYVMEPGGGVIADCALKDDADRIARLPRLERAARLVMERKCERFTGPRTCRDHPELSPQARYTADSWCATCILAAALDEGQP